MISGHESNRNAPAPAALEPRGLSAAGIYLVLGEPAEALFLMGVRRHRHHPGAGAQDAAGAGVAARAVGAHYTDPGTWRATAPGHEGSWWPALDEWLTRHAGEPVAPPAMGSDAHGYRALEGAPGRYVMLA